MTEDADLPDEVSVKAYGIRHLKRIRALIDSLAAARCYPTSIYRVYPDKQIFAVEDAVRASRDEPCIIYVRVLRWCDDYPGPPVIEWNTDAQMIRHSLRSAATKMMRDMTYGTRVTPTSLLNYDFRRHRELVSLHATVDSPAS